MAVRREARPVVVLVMGCLVDTRIGSRSMNIRAGEACHPGKCGVSARS
jgi:hypothetical protein